MKKGEIKMTTQVSIIPFGQVIITIKSSRNRIKKIEEKPIYAEPQKTEQSLTVFNF